jgi:hypothetical protein
LNGKIIFAAGFLALLVAMTGITSCRTAKPLPSADLSAPGWQVLQGQALWKPDRTRPEVVGDLLLATNAAGDCFVQLNKNPFPVVTAERLGERWQIQFGAGDYSRRGFGAPPDRFSWFQLPCALSGGRPGGDWRFENMASNACRLENAKTGETLEVVIIP